MQKWQNSEIFQGVEPLVFHQITPRMFFAAEKRAVTVACIVDNNGACFISQAVCKKGEQFSRKIGYAIAVGRAKALAAMHNQVISKSYVSGKHQFTKLGRLRNMSFGVDSVGEVNLKLKDIMRYFDDDRTESYIESVCQKIRENVGPPDRLTTIEEIHDGMRFYCLEGGVEENEADLEVTIVVPESLLTDDKTTEFMKVFENAGVFNVTYKLRAARPDEKIQWPL